MNAAAKNTTGVISPLRIREPGLNTLPANTERYVVRAGGITALDLFAGDRINLVSPEGRQKGEITVFDQHGNSDMQCIEAPGNGRAEGFKHILAGDDANAVGALLSDAINATVPTLAASDLGDGVVLLQVADEDGVRFDGILVPGQSTPITVTAMAPT